MGGKTAQLIASRRVPGLVGLVLIAPSPPTPTILSSEERDQMMHAYDTAESVAFVRDHILTASPLTESQKERVIQDSLRGGHAAKLGWIETAMREDLRTEARKIEVPTLVLSGDQDRVDPPARLRAELMPHIAGAELRTLAGLGHLSMLEAPDAVAQAIREFISGLPVLGSTDL
jgi:pimeloyl-ACP methyl ester carboxylesterase